MPRILGNEIPNDKPTYISLQYLHGIGQYYALEICKKAGLEPRRRAKEMTDDEVARVTALLDRDYVVEGPLKRHVKQNIDRLREIKCYRGIRHRPSNPLPVRGQRTSTNARTRKGARKTVAGKKGVRDLK